MRVHVEKNEKEWKTRDLGGEWLLRRSISPKSPSSSLGIALLASFSNFFFSFRVPFIILGFMEGNLEFFGLFRAFSELYGPIWWSSAAAL